MSTAAFSIGPRRIGPEYPPYVIAEAGVNHNGETDLARRLIDAAADAGADAVKFQTFRARSLATTDAEQADYQRSSNEASSQLDMLEALQLPDPTWAELAAHAQSRDIVMLSTPFDQPSLDLLRALDLPAMKIGSGDLTNAPLLRAVGALGLPVILSTGMGTLADVSAALDQLGRSGSASIALLHCASIYPAALDDANLRAIGTLRDAFGLPVGFSDHTVGTLAAVVAVGAGAAIIEKHLTLDRGLPGPDHASSLEPAELSRLVTDVREGWSALGDGAKKPRPAEREIMRVARRSLVARRALPAGHVVEPDDLDAKRPGTGISPMEIDAVVGRRLRVAVDEDHLLRRADIEPPLESAS